MTSRLPTVAPGSSVLVADYVPGATFGPRRLLDHEFVWILRGSAVWTRVGAGAEAAGSAVELRPGELALAPAGTVDSYQWDRERSTTHAYVHFALTTAGDLPPTSEWPRVRDLAATPVLEGITAYLLQLATRTDETASERSDQLLAVLLDVFTRDPLPAVPLGSPALAAVVEQVAEWWRRDGLRLVEVDDLARACHLSSGHVFRVFREAYGCGPARALELVRLSRAAVALQRSNATLAEVAGQCGFANSYHLSRRFAAAYGMPPGAYRRSGRADALEPVRTAGLLPLVTALLPPGF